MYDRTGWRNMKCFACDGSGIEPCPRCFGEGECAYCGGGGNGPCLLCDGVGEEPHPDSFDKKRWAEVLPTGERGSKQLCVSEPVLMVMSLPTRERGSKRSSPILVPLCWGVAPYAGARIETLQRRCKKTR